LLIYVTYSYLILPLCFILNKAKFKHRILVMLALYGILFFGLLFFYDPDSLNFVNNNYYQGSYTLLEYSIFTYLFWYNIQNKAFRKLMIIVSFLFALYQFFYITSATFARLDSISIGIETILIFIYIFYFFFEFSKNTKDVFIYDHYGFWLAVGIMLYLGGSFFFYILINHLDQSEVDKFGNMTYIAEIIKNLLFAFSIFLYKKFPFNNIHNHPKKIPNLDMNLI
jgi:hypothetical protein